MMMDANAQQMLNATHKDVSLVYVNLTALPYIKVEAMKHHVIALVMMNVYQDSAQVTHASHCAQFLK